MADSVPPPSEQMVKSGGSGPYIIGIVVLGLLTAGLIYWKTRPSPLERPPLAPTAPLLPVPTAPPELLHAPPPPPPLEEVEKDAGVQPAQTASRTAVGGTGPCSKCGEGEPSPALASAVNTAAQSARGCYTRALRTTEASGKMDVSVQVGSTGAVCNATITSDTVHSSEIASCVLSRFRGKSFPPPKSGCVVVNVPLTFTIKQ